MKNFLQTPTGTHDIMPEEQKYWSYLFDVFEKRVLAFGLEKIDTPIFEYKNVFSRAIGETTDIVEKEMYQVQRYSDNAEEENDDSKEPLALRPEGTASVVRAYIQHGMISWPQPVKLYYLGPMFRYDKPQKGRFRQFWQAGIEIFGDGEPLTDALTILLLWQIASDLGLKDKTIINVNSLGCRTCRTKFRKKLLDYYKPYENVLCLNCTRRYQNNPLRLLDCKEEKCQQIAQASPQIIDNLCKECKDHFMKVLEYLDELSIPYHLNPRLVRGLDYYTRTTFELVDIDDTSRQSSLGGGGRYDDLIEMFDGPATPAIGWSIGVERVVEKIKELKLEIPKKDVAEIFIIQLGDRARKKALNLVSELSQKGYNVSCILGKESLKSQLRAADKMGVKIALIIGQREVLDNTIIVRNMQEASQETIPLKNLEISLQKKLKNNESSQ